MNVSQSIEKAFEIWINENKKLYLSVGADVARVIFKSGCLAGMVYAIETRKQADKINRFVSIK